MSTSVPIIDSLNKFGLSQFLLHPLVVYTFQHFLFVVIAGFTKPRSILRPLGFVFLAFSSWQALSTFPAYIDTPGWVPRAVASAFPQTMLTFFERVLVRKLSLHTDDEDHKRGAVDHRDCATRREHSVHPNIKRLDTNTFQSRWEFGTRVASSMRGLGTPWEIRNVHPFSTTDPQYVPSPLNFVLWKATTVALCVWVHTFCIDTQLGLDQNLMTPEFIPIFLRLRHVSVEELTVRLIATCTTLISIFCFIQGGYSFVAMVAVCVRPSTVKEWRPVFGPAVDSYNLRRFWATFWHQGLQNNLRGTAQFITSNVLHLRSRTLFTRYFKIFLAFFLAGVLHIPSDMGSGVPFRQSGAVRFWSTQIIGLMIEDIVQAVYRRTCGVKGVSKPVEALLRIVGYAWVLIFLTWAGPVRWYPIIRKERSETELIRWSALHPLAKPFLSNEAGTP